MKIIKYSIPYFVIFFIAEFFLNFFNIRPVSNNFGWLNAHDTYKDIIKNIETNEFGTRDINQSKRLQKPNIILLGDSQVELAQPPHNQLPL